LRGSGASRGYGSSRGSGGSRLCGAGSAAIGVAPRSLNASHEATR